MAATDLFTLLDLKTQVCLNLGATDDISMAKAGKLINRALIRFSEMGEWSWQRVYDQAFPGATSVTVIGQRNYEVRNCLRMTSLYIASPSERRLQLLGDREYRQRYPNDTATGTPYHYLHRGRLADATNKDILKIGLYPIPDAAYTLKWDGVRPIALLSSDTDDIRVLTGMPVKIVDIVIEMATAIGWKEIDDADAATQMQEVLSRLKGVYDDDRHDVEDVHVMASFDGDMDFADPVLPPEYGR